jgi:hypothetical protein
MICLRCLSFLHLRTEASQHKQEEWDGHYEPYPQLAEGARRPGPEQAFLAPRSAGHYDHVFPCVVLNDGPSHIGTPFAQGQNRLASVGGEAPCPSASCHYVLLPLSTLIGSVLPKGVDDLPRSVNPPAPRIAGQYAAQSLTIINRPLACKPSQTNREYECADEQRAKTKLTPAKSHVLRFFIRLQVSHRVDGEKGFRLWAQSGAGLWGIVSAVPTQVKCTRIGLPATRTLPLRQCCRLVARVGLGAIVAHACHCTTGRRPPNVWSAVTRHRFLLWRMPKEIQSGDKSPHSMELQRTSRVANHRSTGTSPVVACAKSGDRCSGQSALDGGKPRRGVPQSSWPCCGSTPTHATMGLVPVER